MAKTNKWDNPRELFAAEIEAAGVALAARQAIADSTARESDQGAAALEFLQTGGISAEHGNLATGAEIAEGKALAAEGGLWTRRYELVQAALAAEAASLRAKALEAQATLDEHKAAVQAALSEAVRLETPSEADEPVSFVAAWDVADLQMMALTGEKQPTVTRSYLLGLEVDATIAVADQAASRKPTTAGSITGELVDATSIRQAWQTWCEERLATSLGPRWSELEPAAQRLMTDAESAWRTDPSATFRFEIQFNDGKITKARLERQPAPRPVAMAA